MPTPVKSKRWKLLVAAAFVVVAAFVLLAFSAHVVEIALNWDDYKAFKSLRHGMTEAEVVAKLGKPHKVFEKATAPANYYVDGYTFKKREISNRVLIYYSHEPIAYVYLDGDNRVEEVFIGWS